MPPGPASILGRGLIVHAAPDDYKTQPTGNAGARSGAIARINLRMAGEKILFEHRTALTVAVKG